MTELATRVLHPGHCESCEFQPGVSAGTPITTEPPSTGVPSSWIGAEVMFVDDPLDAELPQDAATRAIATTTTTKPVVADLPRGRPRPET